MRKIQFAILNLEPKDNAGVYWNNFKGNMVHFIESNNEQYWVMKTKYSHEKIIPYPYIINISSEQFLEVIRNVVRKSTIKANSIDPSEPINVTESEIISLQESLLSVVNKYIYHNVEENGHVCIFEFSIHLFIRILMGHKLKNGNKRTAISFLKSILYYFGYYLKWTGGEKESYSKYKVDIEDFVISLQRKEKLANIFYWFSKESQFFIFKK